MSKLVLLHSFETNVRRNLKADSLSRYKNGTADGPVTGPWCGTTWHFNEALRNPRWEDYNFTYRSRNRFAYMGIGRTRGELRGDDMASVYLREPGAD